VVQADDVAATPRRSWAGVQPLGSRREQPASARRQRRMAATPAMMTDDDDSDYTGFYRHFGMAEFKYIRNFAYICVKTRLYIKYL
jgi:hypothetical protein